MDTLLFADDIVVRPFIDRDGAIAIGGVVVPVIIGIGVWLRQLIKELRDDRNKVDADYKALVERLLNTNDAQTNAAKAQAEAAILSARALEANSLQTAKTHEAMMATQRAVESLPRLYADAVKHKTPKGA